MFLFSLYFPCTIFMFSFFFKISKHYLHGKICFNHIFVLLVISQKQKIILHDIREEGDKVFDGTVNKDLCDNVLKILMSGKKG